MSKLLHDIMGEFSKNIIETVILSPEKIKEYRKDSSDPQSGEYAHLRDRAILEVMRDIVAVANEMGLEKSEAWSEFKDDIVSNTLLPIHRQMKKYTWYSPRDLESEIVSEIDRKLSSEQDLSESRPTNAFGFISQLKTLPMVAEIVDIRGQIDGYTAFVRTKDGNAYEIEIRPAAVAKKHPELTSKKG